MLMVWVLGDYFSSLNNDVQTLLKPMHICCQSEEILEIRLAENAIGDASAYKRANAVLGDLFERGASAFPKLLKRTPGWPRNKGQCGLAGKRGNGHGATSTQRIAQIQRKHNDFVVDPLAGIKTVGIQPGAALQDAWLRQRLFAKLEQRRFASASVPMLPPDQAAREVLLERVAGFVARLAPRLPNFYAERDTVQFGEPPPKRGQTWKTAQQDRKLYYEVTRTDHIYFEDGKERTDPQKLKVTASTRHSLETTGTFGPILVLALKAATSQAGTLIWSHWEKSPEGPLAVFQYLAPPDMQLYGVGFCCMAVDDGMLPFHRNSAFRGELAVHPATGHIVRLTVEADLEPTLPLEISAIMVEYGQVDMGAKTYVCPLRSVSMSRHRRLWELNEWGLTFKIYGPFETVLNDVTFNRYHLFSSQTTIMPGFVPVPQ